MEIKDTFAGGEPGVQLIRIDGFDEIIVGARLEAVEHLLLAATAGHQDDIRIGLFGLLPQRLADADPVHPRHDPVEHRKRGRICGAQECQGGRSVAGLDWLEIPLGQE